MASLIVCPMLAGCSNNWFIRETTDPFRDDPVFTPKEKEGEPLCGVQVRYASFSQFPFVSGYEYEQMDPYHYTMDGNAGTPLFDSAQPSDAGLDTLKTSVHDASQVAPDQAQREKIASDLALGIATTSSQTASLASVDATHAANDANNPALLTKAQTDAQSAITDAINAINQANAANNSSSIQLIQLSVGAPAAGAIPGNPLAQTNIPVSLSEIQQRISDAEADAQNTSAKNGPSFQTAATYLKAALDEVQKYKSQLERADTATKCAAIAKNASDAANTAATNANVPSLNYAGKAADAIIAADDAQIAQRAAISARVAAGEYDGFVALGPAEYARNSLQSRMMAVSDADVAGHLSRITGTQIVFNTVTGALALGTSAAATLSGGGAGTALAATTTGLLGFKSLFNDEVYRNTLVETLVDCINADRGLLRKKMLFNQRKLITDYSVQQAVNDAIEYHDHGSFYYGLTLIRQSAEESNANKRKEAASTQPSTQPSAQ